jgi:hypothetical protein
VLTRALGFAYSLNLAFDSGAMDISVFPLVIRLEGNTTRLSAVLASVIPQGNNCQLSRPSFSLSPRVSRKLQ